MAVEIPEPVRRATLAPGGAVFTAWMNAAAKGENPALVLSSQASEFERVLPPASAGTPGVYSAVSDSEMFDE